MEPGWVHFYLAQVDLVLQFFLLVEQVGLFLLQSLQLLLAIAETSLHALFGHRVVIQSAANILLLNLDLLKNGSTKVSEILFLWNTLQIAGDCIRDTR